MSNLFVNDRDITIFGPDDRPLPTSADLHEALALKELEIREERANSEHLKESLAELELAIEDTGWQRIGDGAGNREFSRAALRKLFHLSRMMFLKNPLIKNGAMIQSHYVWGQGVNITAPNPDIQDLLNAWINDRQNASEFTGHRMRKMREVEQKVIGNIFFMLFVNMSTGWVRLASVHQDEIIKIICNPDNGNEPWFYCREYSVQDINQVSSQSRKTWYPDWRYKYSVDAVNPGKVQGDELDWEHPIYHIKTGHLPGMKFGIPETYAALDWARAVKDDLEDYATTKRALATFAWKLSVKGGKGAVAQGKKKFGSTFATSGTLHETNPPATRGATFIHSEGAGDLNPIRTAGMTPNPEDGQRLWLMVCAAMGIPETILAGNADIGNYATSKTLDRPTELQMEDRRELWSDVLLDLFNFLIDRVIEAPNGVLDGDSINNKYTGEPEWVLVKNPDANAEDDESDGGDRTIHIDFPPILEHDILETVQAVQIALSTNLLPPRVMARVLASAFGETDVDEILKNLEERLDAIQTQPSVGQADPSNSIQPGDPSSNSDPNPTNSNPSSGVVA